MMKILLLICSSLPCFAQVNIKPETARYYLEIEDKYYLELEKDSMQIELIRVLRNESSLKTEIIKLQEESITTLKLLIETKEQQNTLNREEVAILKKELRKEKFLRIVTSVGSVIVIILVI